MKIFRYDPTKHGLERWLGPLTAPVMDWLWDWYEQAEHEQRKRIEITVRGVVKHYKPRLHYNTAATTMDRLVGYGLLAVVKRKNTRYFSLCYSRKQWETAQLDAIRASVEDAVAVGDDGWGTGGWE